MQDEQVEPSLLEACAHPQHVTSSLPSASKNSSLSSLLPQQSTSKNSSLLAQKSYSLLSRQEKVFLQVNFCPLKVRGSHLKLLLEKYTKTFVFMPTPRRLQVLGRHQQKKVYFRALPESEVTSFRIFWSLFWPSNSPYKGNLLIDWNVDKYFWLRSSNHSPYILAE